MMPAPRAPITPILGAIAGVGIAYVDTRPTWDDAGVTAGAVFLVALILGAARPRTFWITGLAVGIPVWAMNAVLFSHYGAVLAVLVSLVGAGSGAVLGRMIQVGAADEEGGRGHP